MEKVDLLLTAPDKVVKIEKKKDLAIFAKPMLETGS